MGLIRFLAVLALFASLATAASASILVFDGDEPGYRSALFTYDIDTTVIGFDDLQEDDLVTNQYVGSGVLFIPGNDGLNVLRVNNDMSDVPPISNPWGIQIFDDSDYQSEFSVQFNAPVRTVALWHAAVAASGGNVLRATLTLDGSTVGTYDLTNSKDVSRFAGLVANDGEMFDGVQFTSLKLGDEWGFDNFEFDKSAIPEPGTIVLMAGGLVGMSGLIRRRK